MKNRRDFLRLSGIAGAAALMPFTKILASGSDVNVCSLIPSETEGPFPYPGGELGNPLNQVDIRQGQTGIQLDLVITVVDVATCTPLPFVRVDIWHCNKDGDYSGYGSFANEYWLRGWQMTNANGEAMFTTIYPGWYTGRATHIHVEAFYNNQMIRISQFAFDESVSNTVHVVSPYTKGINTTTNMGDGILGNSAADLAKEMLVITGNTTTGYTGTITMGVSGVPLGVKSPGTLEGINVYPNSVSDKLVISHPSADFNTTVKVMTIEGKLAATGMLKPGATVTSVDVALLSKGVYILLVENAGKKSVIKFVKE